MKTTLVACLLVVISLIAVPGIAQDCLKLVGQFPEDPPYPSLYETAIQGDYAYITTGGGLQIYDISDPSNPTEEGYCNIVAEGLGAVGCVEVLGDYAYVCAREGFVVVDVSNPAAPSVAGSSDKVWQPKNVVLQYPYAYVGDSIRLKVFDVSNPLSPEQVGYSGNGWVDGLAIPSPGVLVGARGYYLEIFDIGSDPENPPNVKTWNAGTSYTNAQALAGSGSLVYWPSSYDNGLRIIDISDRLNPVEVGFWNPTSMDLYDIELRNDHVFLADEYPFPGRAVVVDVSDPALPVEVDSYPGRAQTSSLALGNDGLLLFTDSNGGFRLFSECVTVIFKDGFESGDTSAW